MASGLLERRPPEPLELPDELVEVHAFFLWRQRCEAAGGRDLHGGDREDWFHAKGDLNDILSRLTREQWRDIEAELDRHGRGRIQPSPEAVHTRAYYKWEARKQAGHEPSEEQQRQDWREAEEEERQRVFARVFYSLLPALNTPQTKRLYDYLVRGYNMNGDPRTN